MRIDDLSATWGRFVARDSASVAAVDRCPSLRRALPAADNDFTPFFAVPTEVGAGPAEAPAAATPVAQPTPSRSPTQGNDSVDTMGPTASAPAWPGPPAPPTVKPSSDRIFSRTRRRTATAAGAAPRAGGAPRLYARRANTLPRVSRLRPDPSTTTTPAPSVSSVLTVLIPSNHDRGEPVGTPLLRLLFFLGDTAPAPFKLGALGDAAEFSFIDSVTRYSQADWEREQQAQPTCHAAMRYITIGQPSSLPADFLSCYPSHKRPSLSDIQELAGKGR